MDEPAKPTPPAAPSPEAQPLALTDDPRAALPKLQPTQAPGPNVMVTAPAPSSAAPVAVRMTEPGRGPEAFPSDDPRAGAYHPGVIYLIPDQVSAEKAKSLVDGGGYEYCPKP